MHLPPFTVQKSLEAYTGGWLTEVSRGMIPPHPQSWHSVAGWPQSAGFQPARRYVSSLQLLLMVRMQNILIWNLDHPYERHGRSLLQWSSKERDSAATGSALGFLGNRAVDMGLRLVCHYQRRQRWSLIIARCLACSCSPRFHQMWGTFIHPVSQGIGVRVIGISRCKRLHCSQWLSFRMLWWSKSREGILILYCRNADGLSAGSFCAHSGRAPVVCACCYSCRHLVTGWNHTDSSLLPHPPLGSQFLSVSHSSREHVIFIPV